MNQQLALSFDVLGESSVLPTLADVVAMQNAQAIAAMTLRKGLASHTTSFSATTANILLKGDSNPSVSKELLSQAANALKQNLMDAVAAWDVTQVVKATPTQAARFTSMWMPKVPVAAEKVFLLPKKEKGSSQGEDARTEGGQWRTGQEVCHLRNRVGGCVHSCVHGHDC